MTFDVCSRCTTTTNCQTHAALFAQVERADRAERERDEAQAYITLLDQTCESLGLKSVGTVALRELHDRATTAEAQVAKVREYAESLTRQETKDVPSFNMSPAQQRRQAAAGHARTVGYTLIGMLNQTAALGSVGRANKQEPEPDLPDGLRTQLDTRNPLCVEKWPECVDGAYHPSCCRFPKSCSCERQPGSKP